VLSRISKEMIEGPSPRHKYVIILDPGEVTKVEYIKRWDWNRYSFLERENHRRDSMD